jgi:hypothetical protein
MSTESKVYHMIREFESFVDKLNDPRLDVPDVARQLVERRSLVMWTEVAGLCHKEALAIFDMVVYDNLWCEPASLASRRINGWLDSLFFSAAQAHPRSIS